MVNYLTFIDVSKWQGQTKWRVVKRAGIDFAYIRALKGYEVDPILAGNTKRCTNVELPHGQYGWWQPELDPLTQAKLLVELHYEHGSLLVPMLDVEENKEGMRPIHVRQRLRKTVDYIISKIGKPPTIYTASWFWNKSVNSKQFNQCPLVVAEYRYYSLDACRANPVPIDPKEWGKFALSGGCKPTPVKGWKAWSGFQFSAGFNEQGKRLGVESRDLDLNIMKAGQYPRFLCP